MPKLEKSVLALTFKFDCDRFLRFRLASKEEQEAYGIDAARGKRPGIQLVEAAGGAWEASKYQDLLAVAGPGNVEHIIDSQVDRTIGQRRFQPVEDVFDVLRRIRPPTAIIEGQFKVPESVTPNLKNICETYGIKTVRARPDIMWIRPGGTGAPLLRAPSIIPEYEIHIIDVKMAAEPSLRHFAEVTFYAVALARAIEEQGLAARYAVSAEGFIWPGSHDANAFRNLYHELQSSNAPNPLTEALLKTLVRVPYEVYQVHVQQFFEERLPRVLAQQPLDAAWHVAPRCQLCDYLPFCRDQAQRADHLCRIPWLNRGHADILRSVGIQTTHELMEAVEVKSTAWQSAMASSHQLRADSAAFAARARALWTGQPELIADRKLATMPPWSNMNIYVTIHFDPGSGITFALGTRRVYFPPDWTAGDRPVDDERVFVVDRVDHLNPDTERARLVEFAQLITGWLNEAHETNEQIRRDRQARGERDREFGKVSAHIFFWDSLEVEQLRRMVKRHMGHPDVVGIIELLARLFPPEGMLPDPEYFKSQPGTIVKEALRLLVGLPLDHTYTLLDAANVLFPRQTSDGALYRFQVAYGFGTEMSDQIPFERAYELWQDRIYLRHYDERYPTQPDRWRKYSRDEVYEGVKRTVRTHLGALDHIVSGLRKHYRDRLTLRKPAFSASPPTQTRIPEEARRLIAFHQIDELSQEIQNQQQRALPIEEREARFIAIRGLQLVSGLPYDQFAAGLRQANPRLAPRAILTFTFAGSSRDARCKEGDFLLALSNEDDQRDLDVRWYTHLGLSWSDAQNLLLTRGLDRHWRGAPLKKLVQVELVGLEATQDPPYLALAPAEPDAFQFAQDVGLLDLTRPMVLDPFVQDFTTELVENALRVIGGVPPRMRPRGSR